MNNINYYRLSKIVEISTGESIHNKAIVGKYHTIYENDLREGKELKFRDIDHPLGSQQHGIIKSIRENVIRKRPYIIVETDSREYYLTPHQRQGEAK